MKNAGQAPGRLERLARSGERAYEWLMTGRRADVAVLGIILLVAMHSFLLIGRRALWFDEIISFYNLRSIQDSSVLEMLARGGDMSPPMLYWVAKAAGRVLGVSEFLFRYLSALFGCGLLWIVYVLIRGWAGRMAGCIAVLGLCHTAALMYFVEGRPYAMFSLFIALAALGWDRSTGARRMLAIHGMAVAACLAVATHYYAVFVLVPLSLAQCARDWPRRRPDWPVWAALVSPVVALAWHLPLIAASTKYYGEHHWQATLAEPLPEIYRGLFDGLGVPVVLLLVLYWISKGDGAGKSEGRLPAPVLLLIAGFLLLPAVGALAAKMTGSAVVMRYVLPGVIGMAAAVAVAYSWRPLAPAAGFVLLVLFVASLGRPIRMEWLHNQKPAVSFDWLRANKAAFTGPVLVSDGHLFLLLYHYRDRERLPFVSYPASAEMELRYLGTSEFLLNLQATAHAEPALPFRPWVRPQAGPWRFQVLRKRGVPTWELAETIRLGGTAKLELAGDGFELFNVEIPPGR